MPTVEFFVDEARRRDYLLCAAVVADRDVESARRMMRELKPNNRNRLHLKDETRNRDRIISDFMRLRPIAEAHIFVGKMRGHRHSERDIRTRCLDAMACYAAQARATRILIESCSQDKQDMAAPTAALARVGALDRIRVAIDRPTAHELLWAADLVAWCYGAGGRARQLIEPLTTVHTVC